MNSSTREQPQAVVFDQVSKSYHVNRAIDSFRHVVATLKNGTIGRKHQRPADFQALRALSFTIKPGERVAFIGRNGAGKSTILKMVQGVTHPTQGRVTVQGKVGGLIELGAAFVPTFSARENIMLSCAMHGIARQNAKKLVSVIAELAEVTQFLDVPLSRFSSGMKVRLGFVAALMTVPDIILLDEVLAVGDENFKKKSFAMLEQYLDQRTVLFVSHNMNHVRKVCDRCIYLRNGEIRFDGDPEAAIQQYLSEADGDEPARRVILNPMRIGNPLQATVSVAEVRLEHDESSDVVRAELDLNVTNPCGHLLVEVGISRKAADALASFIGGRCLSFPDIGTRGRHQVVCEFDASILTDQAYEITFKPFFSEQPGKAAQEHIKIDLKLNRVPTPGLMGGVDFRIVRGQGQGRPGDSA